MKFVLLALVFGSWEQIENEAGQKNTHTSKSPGLYIQVWSKSLFVYYKKLNVLGKPNIKILT